MIFIVTLQDKMLYGEPDIAIAIVDAPDEIEARRAADTTIDALADKGRGRCVPHVRAIDLGRFYRLGAVVQIPSSAAADKIWNDHLDNTFVLIQCPNKEDA